VDLSPAQGTGTYTHLKSTVDKDLLYKLYYLLRFSVHRNQQKRVKPGLKARLFHLAKSKVPDKLRAYYIRGVNQRQAENEEYC
jgi:hypothetical protein